MQYVGDSLPLQFNPSDNNAVVSWCFNINRTALLFGLAVITTFAVTIGLGTILAIWINKDMRKWSQNQKLIVALCLFTQYFPFLALFYLLSRNKKLAK